MDEQQPTFKVVDRRPFNPDGTPRELSPEEKKEAAQVVESPKSAEPPPEQAPAPTDRQATNTSRPESQESPTPPLGQSEAGPRTGDPLDDPASFLSLIMSLASNAAANLGMMPHPVTGETGVDLKTAKHWIDILGMLERKTKGNLDAQEAEALEGLLADLRMQFVSFTNAPSPPPKFSAVDITGGKQLALPFIVLGNHFPFLI